MPVSPSRHSRWCFGKDRGPGRDGGRVPPDPGIGMKARGIAYFKQPESAFFGEGKRAVIAEI